MGKILNFTSNTLKLSEIENNKQFLKCTFYAISEGTNRNKTGFTKEALEGALATVVNKPILAYFDKSEGSGDFGAHELEVTYDNISDELYFDCLNGERPIGLIPESATVTIEEFKGKNWLKFDGLIWKKYNKYAYDLLKLRRSNRVSVEIEVYDSETKDDGFEWINSFVFNGVTLLGKKINEGIEGAHLRISDVVETKQYETFKEVITFALKSEGKGGDSEVFHGLTMNELCARIRNILRDNSYEDSEDNKDYYKYGLEDLDDFHVYVNDWQEGKIYKVPYFVDESGKVTVDFETKEEVEIDIVYVPRHYGKLEVYLAKDKWGTGDSLKVDKSADSISEDSWGSVNKTKLKNDILKAKNYKSLVKSVYLYVGSDWEDSPTGSDGLKYPVMQLKGDTLVYNKRGISAALSYAVKNGEQSVVKKAKALQRKLKLVEEVKR